MKALHILNGDAISGVMEDANIFGDWMGWCEVVVEGPAAEEVEGFLCWTFSGM